MSQIAHPIQDISAGSWTPTPLYQEIDEEVPSDADKVASANNPNLDTFVVQLEPLNWPQPGDQTLTIRLRRTAAETVGARIELLQGTTSIARMVVRCPSMSFQDVSLVITEQQRRLITDYTNLRARVTALTQFPCPEANEIQSVTIIDAIGNEYPLNGQIPAPICSLGVQDFTWGGEFPGKNFWFRAVFDEFAGKVMFHWLYEEYSGATCLANRSCSLHCGDPNLVVDDVAQTVESLFFCASYRFRATYQANGSCP